MVGLEIPVVTTSLVAVADELSGFDKSSWVLSSYLLGYGAVIVIFAKFSDIFGRKPMFLLSIIIFIIFSAACSASQTMTQLIIFRAFQGIGGGGCFSMSQVIITDLVPPTKFSIYTSQLSTVSSIALLLGPIVGGAISANTTWRWIFIINVPISSVALVFAIIGLPRGFGFRDSPDHRQSSLANMFSNSTMARIDIPGTILLLFAVLLLTAGFEEADSAFPWRSAYVITLLILSGLFWFLLLLWERRVTKTESVREPVLPWRFFTNRVMIGVLLGLLFLGGPITVTIFQLPERFQLVYGLSSLDAGVRLIPFSLAVPLGTGLASGIASKYRVPAMFIIVVGSCTQVVGFALLATVPNTLTIPPRIYGFEILAGFGAGMNYTPLLLIVPRTVELRDQAVGFGASNQVRMVGSAIAMAVSTSVLNGTIKSPLATLLGSSGENELAALGQQLSSLPVDVQDEVRLILSKGYNRQMLVLCVCAAAQLPAALLLWKKNQIRV
ncbi:major facilitator superfamily MFS-1 [Hypoxylon sp. FL1284]|nr:major facilitator superfamily MFS-1 [Hypoxylon sp. FL1284]